VYGLPVIDVDPYEEALLRAPEPWYAALRDAGPLVWIPRHGVCASGRIDVVEPLFRDWRRFCSSRGVGLSDFKREPPWRPPSIVLEVDPPAHDRTRAVLARALSPQAVAAREPDFAAAAGRHVAGALAAGRIDGLRDLAAAYVLEAFGDAVGLDGTARETLLEYGTMVFNALGPDNAIRRRSLADAPRVTAWIAARCTRAALRPDGLGSAIHAAAERGAVSADEAALLVRSLLSAGIDTTVATLANLLWCFATHPAQWRALRADAALVPAAIDEVLRFCSPVHTFCRTTDAAVELAGTALPEGTKILCVMAAANRDPARWENAEDFDIARPARPHVAFGSGIHVCVGQHLARREIAALVSTMRERVAEIELAGPAEWLPGNAVRTLARLPLALAAA
jgi:4-methoxybenzoate monooxygenase (O-demethylating)